MTAADTVHVIASSPEGTRHALGIATAMARGTGARVALLLRRAFPDGLAASPDLNSDETEQRIKEMVEASDPRPSVVAYVSKHPLDVFQLFASPGIVVIGGESRRWFPTPEQRLARDLTRLGCHVTFVQVTPQ